MFGWKHAIVENMQLLFFMIYHKDGQPCVCA